MKKIRVAVIGCGRISVMHFESIRTLDNLELVACCDIKKDRAEEAAAKYGGKVYTDYTEMLATEELDAIHICLPHYLHSKVAIAAFERGVAALSEKPMDISYEAAENAVRIAKEKNVLFGIISQCRYNNPAVLVKKAVTSGKLGKIISARSTLTWSRSASYYAESDWKGTWDKEGGGVVIDQAIHSIDLVNWMVNSTPKRVSCMMAKHSTKPLDVEDTADGLIEYENGTVYGFYCMNNYAVDEPIEIRLYCENGKVIFGYSHAYISYNDGTTEEAHHNAESVDGAKDYWGNWHIRQIEQFYKAYEGKEPLEISGEEALKTHALVCEIYKKGKKYMGLA